MKKIIVYLDENAPDEYIEFLASHIFKDRFVKKVEIETRIKRGGDNVRQG